MIEDKYEKNNVYMHVYLGHFAVQQKLTEHCKSTNKKEKRKRIYNKLKMTFYDFHT